MTLQTECETDKWVIITGRVAVTDDEDNNNINDNDNEEDDYDDDDGTV